MTIDPEQARQILEGVLTLAGGAVAAAIIASVIQLLKSVPRFGDLLDAGREYILAIVLSAVLIVYAAIATANPLDLVSAFGLFLAWLALSAIVGKAYDAGHAAKSAISGP